MAEAPAIPALSEIQKRRRTLAARHRELVEQRPQLALAAAGGDSEAIECAREHADELSSVVLQLEGLELAESEARRLADERYEQRAAEERKRLLDERAEVRRAFGDDLLAVEALFRELGGLLGRVAEHARADVRLSSLAGERISATEVACRNRIIGRLISVVGGVWRLSIPGAPDHRPLGLDDVYG